TDPAQPSEGAPDAAAGPVNGDADGGVTDTAATPPAEALTAELQPGDLSEPDADAALQTSLEEQQAYDQAFALLKQSRYAEAIEQFQELADTWPGSQLADDAYFMQAKAHLFSRENRDALAAFENVVARYPGSDKTPEALLGMGDIHFDIGAYPRAAEIYREVLRRFPVHKVAVPAEIRLRRITQNIEQTVQ
ncbi:MAG: tetratricopeptide repeat protein, partial [Gammaproteobacteria bacterium]